MPRKKKSLREKIRKYAGQKFKLPKKNWIKIVREKFKLLEKKSKKSAKKRFLGRDSFSPLKNNTYWGVSPFFGERVVFCLLRLLIY